MATDRERLFGDDLALHDTLGGADLQEDPRGDLALAHGNVNVEQALVMRLRVRRGELAALGWPAYGSRIHELIGKPNLKRTHVMLMAFARQAIEEDPRVADIVDIAATTIQGERDTVRLSITINLIEQQTPLNLVFDVGLGGTP